MTTYNKMGWVDREAGHSVEGPALQRHETHERVCHPRSRAPGVDGKADDGEVGRDQIMKETLDLISYEKGFFWLHYGD